MSVSKELVDIIKALGERKTNGYDTPAIVTRIEGGTAWVHIDGGVDETPVQLTINAAQGDNVQVRVADGRAWLTGNASAPPTDDATAIRAQNTANSANQNAEVAAVAAENAVQSAGRAYDAAQQAKNSADEAETSASEAKVSANEASKQATYATISANNALTQLSTVESVVDTLNWITTHSTFKPTEDTSVQSGKIYYLPNNNTLTLTSGTTELNGVTFVVDAEAGTVTANGTATAYTSLDLGIPNVTAGQNIYISGASGGSNQTYWVRYYQAGGASFVYDGIVKATAVANAHCYVGLQNGYTADNLVFTPRVSASNDDYDFEIVSNPTGNPSTQGYYELDTTDAVRDFVKAHLALNNDGLYVLKDGNGWKVLISNDHIEIQDDSGNVVANFGETIVLSAPDSTATMEIYSSGFTLEDSSGSGGLVDLKGDSLRIWDDNGGLIANIGGGIQGGSGSTWGKFYALGQGLISHINRSYQTIIGKYNNPSVNDIFEIGNGSSNSDRKNIFAVRATGIIDGENVLTYGECDTAAATAAKTATVAFGSFTLQTGATVAIKFTNSNTVANPTLNVNGTGAKAIMRYGTTAASTSAESSWNAGSVVTFLYDGTYWQMIDFNNTTYSGMTDAEYQAGTGTTNRLITPARLVNAIKYWAVALTDKYTRSSVGHLDWSNQTDGDAKVIAKSALAFWNGCYSGTNSNLTYCNKGAFGTLATKNSLSASDVGAVARSAVCYANSRVDTFPSSGQITIALSSLGITTGAKPVGILLTYQDGGASPTILRYDYDASSASGVVIKAYNSSGGAVSGAVRYFAVVFQNGWTSA